MKPHLGAPDQQVALPQGVLGESRDLPSVAPPFQHVVCKVTGRRRRSAEDRALELLWAGTGTAHCLLLWPHLLARDAGKCSLTTRGQEVVTEAQPRVFRPVVARSHVLSDTFMHSHAHRSSDPGLGAGGPHTNHVQSTGSLTCTHVR